MTTQPDQAFALDTDRLRLRPYRVEDQDDLFGIIGDAETMRFYPRPYTREETLGWITDQLERYERDGFGLWVIEDKADGGFLGNCGPAIRTVEGQDEVELGWHVKRSAWGRGIAPEAAAACRDHSLGVLGIDRLISLVRPENGPSRRVAEKIGMRVDRMADYKGIPHLVYSISRPSVTDGAGDLQ
jgi:RimJ/RimL family protein N-acetyltransferase